MPALRLFKQDTTGTGLTLRQEASSSRASGMRPSPTSRGPPCFSKERSKRPGPRAKSISNGTWTSSLITTQVETEMKRSEYYCSYPTTSCHIHTNSTDGKAPATVNSFFTARPANASAITCLSSSSLLYTSSADPTVPQAMQFSFIAKVTVQGATATCSSSNGTISISAGATDVFWSIVGDTQYDIDRGTPETGFTFSNGKNTAAAAKALIATVDDLSASQIAAQHASDWSALYNGFELVLGDVSEISDAKTTNASIEAFTWEKGDLLLENNV